MGIIYSYCFGQPSGREAIYTVSQEEPVKEYSWDKKENKLDPKNFMFDGLENEIQIKTPGQINGQQFIIQNCKGSKLFLFDSSASVNIDDCTDCSIYIGPCKGSVFNNRWSNIHDFTPSGKGEGKNYSYCDIAADQNNFVNFQDVLEMGAPKVCCTKESSDIPLTLGVRSKPSKIMTFVVVFSSDDGISMLRNRCSRLIQAVQQKHDASLVCTKELCMQPQDIERTLESPDLRKFAQKGPLIGLEYCGLEAAEACKEFSQSEGFGEFMFISETPDKHLRSFYSFADMQLGV